MIVTGAAGLLGSAICLELLKRNAKVAAWDINKDGLKNLKSKVHSQFTDVKKLIVQEVDICSTEKVISAMDTILKLDGYVVGLINNAANNPKVEENTLLTKGIETQDIETWKKDIEVGLTGTFNCSRIVGSKMVKSGQPCSILNISSDLGLIAPNQNLYKNENGTTVYKPASYSAVKHGVNGLTKYFATYWAGENIRCNSICPGGIYDSQDEKFVERLAKLIPMGRMAHMEEIVNAIIFLISKESSYMNGAIVPVDGGRTTW